MVILNNDLLKFSLTYPQSLLLIQLYQFQIFLSIPLHFQNTGYRSGLLSLTCLKYNLDQYDDRDRVLIENNLLFLDFPAHEAQLNILPQGRLDLFQMPSYWI